ncbi:unnamed protein product [Ectocarpus sp. 12 AP-2014]
MVRGTPQLAFSSLDPTIRDTRQAVSRMAPAEIVIAAARWLGVSSTLCRMGLEYDTYASASLGGDSRPAPPNFPLVPPPATCCCCCFPSYSSSSLTSGSLKSSSPYFSPLHHVRRHCQ